MSKRKNIKGVAYIAEILRKKKPNSFTSKKSATQKAREVNKELKKLGKNPTIKNILPLAKVEVKKKTKRKFTPRLAKDFTDVRNYFALADYPNLIQTKAKNNIWFRSKLSKSTMPLIRGGSKIDYEEYFKEFVDYVNTMTSMLDDKTRYEVDWFVTTKKPVFENGKWIAEIISCTQDGVEFLYGFNVQKPIEPKEVVTTDVGKKKKPKKESKRDARKLDKKDEIEISKQRQKELEKEIELSKQRERESKQIEKESKQREKEADAKMKRIKELKELGFTTKEIMEILNS